MGLKPASLVTTQRSWRIIHAVPFRVIFLIYNIEETVKAPTS